MKEKYEHTWQFKIKEKYLITDLHVQCACHYVGLTNQLQELKNEIKYKEKRIYM